ncbi:zinc ABC transporter substrate-binding protein [Sulfitobacter aestuariivivens]|uniref:High-affinity zinc uptake system protein ZnuA n=1 Tax=Sulfitobacter aestuariivivens TaxID=2766981 RepID=A0A927D203_9RHOB|nr:zinc ABC transporter substrate-binding protein [Sulfitobacter aestuariivivens]MBD3662878.1 zinc ABC transporter substrate-binding protein [Sulfitobacter aestuariivivens]
MLRNVIALLCLSGAALAETPKVATDIAPVHALVSEVMAGIGTPDLVVPATASPHHHAMRPSEARMLSEADIVIWMGPGLTPWLEEPITSLASDARDIRLQDLPGTLALAIREGAFFDSHDHGHDHGQDKDHAHEEEGHAEHADEGHDHEGHEHEEHDHKAEDHADHAHEEDGHHDHAASGGIDPHQWLDASNAIFWMTQIAVALGQQDPDNAERYLANAQAAGESLSAVDAQIEAQLAPVRDAPFLILHDGLQYFEARYGLAAQGAVSDSEDDAPGPARVADLRAALQESDVHCALVEPQSDLRLLETVIEGLDIKIVEIDLIGAHTVGVPKGYEHLLTELSNNIAHCLSR